MSLTVLTASTAAPITLAELRSHVRGSTEDNALITSYALSARHYCETFTRTAVAPTQYRLTQPCLGDVTLPRSPVLSSTSYTTTVSYLVQGASTWTTVASSLYRVEAGTPGRVVLKSGASWPSPTFETGDPVRIDFWAGTTAAPEPIKQAMRLLVGHWYENRESVVVGTVQAKLAHTVSMLLWSERVDV